MKAPLLVVLLALLPASFVVAEPPAIHPEFVEISPENLKELSFDWLTRDRPSQEQFAAITREHRVQVDLAEALKERDRLKARLQELDSQIEILSKQ